MGQPLNSEIGIRLDGALNWDLGPTVESLKSDTGPVKCADYL